MKITFCTNHEDGLLGVNALESGEEVEFREECQSNDDTPLGFLDVSGSAPEDLRPALEALEILGRLNQDGNSVCYALEYIAKMCFEAGARANEQKLFSIS